MVLAPPTYEGAEVPQQGLGEQQGSPSGSSPGAPSRMGGPSLQLLISPAVFGTPRSPYVILSTAFKSIDFFPLPVDGIMLSKGHRRVKNDIRCHVLLPEGSVTLLQAQH